MACFIRGRGRGLTFGGRPDGDIPSPHLVFEVEEAWKKREKDVNRAQHRNASPNQERERERERKRERERERKREKERESTSTAERREAHIGIKKVKRKYVAAYHHSGDVTNNRD